MSDTTDYPCAECGMPIHSRDYHPYGACLMFKSSKKSSTVRENLEFVIEHGRKNAERDLTASLELCLQFRAVAVQLAESVKELHRLEELNQNNIMSDTPTPLTCPSCSSPVISGPRIPLVYGSAATEICTNCLAWRTTHHRPGKWRKDSLEAAIRIRITK